MLQWYEYLRIAQKQSVLQPLVAEPLLVHPVTIIIFAMTGRTETDELWCGVANIMVLVRGMQVNGIHRSCSPGGTFRTVFDVANLAFPSCLFLALPCKKLPIFWVAFPPSAFHIGTPFGGEYCSRNWRYWFSASTLRE
jgi:hypothetical protein